MLESDEEDSQEMIDESRDTMMIVEYDEDDEDDSSEHDRHSVQDNDEQSEDDLSSSSENDIMHEQMCGMLYVCVSSLILFMSSL